MMSWRVGEQVVTMVAGVWGVAAVVLVALLAAVIGLDQASPWLRVVYLIAQWTGPLLLVLLAGYLARRRLAAALRRQLVDIAGPALIRAMPPRAVLSALLPWVYGDGTGHQDVLTGVLGGAGRDPGGRDTAVSRNTSAHFRLRAIDDVTCDSQLTCTHELSGVRDNHRFVIFATLDQAISGLIASERVFPLFELWQVEDEEQLDDFVRVLHDTLQVGVSYTDLNGSVYQVDPRPLRGEEVALRQYDQYVRLPDNVDRKNLRIVQFDLWDLSDPDHVVDSIESLSIRFSRQNPIDLGFLTWSPPHPCFVKQVSIDVTELAPIGRTLVYLVVPFTMKGVAMPTTGRWLQARDRIELDIGSWMLPGHGFTLLWRPVERAEPSGAPEPR